MDMKFEDIGDHIFLFTGVFDDLIDDFIYMFDTAQEKGMTLNRKDYDTKHWTRKKDESIFCHDLPSALLPHSQELVGRIEGDIIPAWEEKYPVITDNHYRGLFVSSAKLQKTLPGGGYHNWHTEHTYKVDSNRTLLAWMLYLNDVNDGGESEFLYQHRRITPERGTFVLWPAGFTHFHRGNPPLSGEKYIATGWIDWF